MNTLPLVSVICLSYNHERFIEEALESLFNQNYGNIEVIIVDDASEDKSSEVIERMVAERADVKYFRNEINLGNCKSFNKAFAESKGSYIIDFALDDILSPGRVQKQVNLFQHLGESFGVVHSDAAIIDEEGSFLSKWSDKLLKVDNGLVFEAILRKSFICPPTMMIRREVLVYLGGYDESLAYEDFDFWVRSSFKFKYFYSPDILTKKRLVKNSLSTKGEQKGNNRIQESTARVCEKANWLVRNDAEKKVLKKRILFEMRHALLVQAYDAVKIYYKILKEMEETGLISFIMSKLAEIKVPTFLFYRLYKKLW
ncbi:glycosyltransferase family 2 protein [Sporocytophaga myxococcoides]|uniref:glycosyltransferase family 2 protein n=1 Tax=Sporocytophaga myxococcoides TaxID=153721 RepID=UPI0004096548|nr:glycosyltransferase [Sporocytophaga myxococcoides]